MKARLILAVLAATAVGAAQADALYHDAVLRPGAGYTFRIGDGGTGTQVRLQSITRGRLDLEDTRVVVAGATADVPFTVPARATRVLLVLDVKCTPVSCGDATVTVLDASGNPIAPAVTSDGSHFEAGFDVAPASAARGVERDGRGGSPAPPAEDALSIALGSEVARTVPGSVCDCRRIDCSKWCAAPEAPSPAPPATVAVPEGEWTAAEVFASRQEAAGPAAVVEGCNCRLPACSKVCAIAVPPSSTAAEATRVAASAEARPRLVGGNLAHRPMSVCDCTLVRCIKWCSAGQPSARAVASALEW